MKSRKVGAHSGDGQSVHVPTNTTYDGMPHHPRHTTNPKPNRKIEASQCGRAIEEREGRQVVGEKSYYEADDGDWKAGDATSDLLLLNAARCLGTDPEIAPLIASGLGLRAVLPRCCLSDSVATRFREWHNRACSRGCEEEAGQGSGTAVRGFLLLGFIILKSYLWKPSQRLDMRCFPGYHPRRLIAISGAREREHVPAIGVGA